MHKFIACRPHKKYSRFFVRLTTHQFDFFRTSTIHKFQFTLDPTTSQKIIKVEPLGLPQLIMELP